MTASPKQIALLTRLVSEREHAIDSIPDELTMGEASKLIDQLFASPRKPRANAEPGYYVADGEVFVVVTNKAQTGTYAKRLVIEGIGHKTAKWRYEPGMGSALADSVPLTVEEAARLGHLHGVCVVCAKRLTDPASVERGIGPVCAKRLS